MFVGHYGVAFAVKSDENKIPLWVLFVAVQLLDFLWAPFVVLGIGKVRMVPGITRPIRLISITCLSRTVSSVRWFGLAWLLPSTEWHRARRLHARRRCSWDLPCFRIGSWI